MSSVDISSRETQHGTDSGEIYTRLAPVSTQMRIDSLDIIRGLAILGIFFINIAPQAASGLWLNPSNSTHWTGADQQAFQWVTIVFDGTQRCLLQLLFGAGMMLLTSRAMKPDGPVAVADLYYRRTLWLLAFGLLDVFGVLWFYDILSWYALSALFLFPFRTLRPKALLATGLGCLVCLAAVEVPSYLDTVRSEQQLATAQAHKTAHRPLTTIDRQALEKEQQKQDAKAHPSEEIRARRAAQLKAHSDGWLAYAQWAWSAWKRQLPSLFAYAIPEGFGTMLIGVALWKWQIIQGGRSRSFYAVLACLCYGAAVPLRALYVRHYWADDSVLTLILCLYGFIRLAMTIGHLAVIHLVLKSHVGRRILAPFKAAGRTAFSLYFLEQIISLHILFAPYGLSLWNRFGWFDLTMIATAMFFGLMIVANIWLRFFHMGPLEWAWRSLSYVKIQPFRRKSAPTRREEILQPLPA